MLTSKPVSRIRIIVSIFALVFLGVIALVLKENKNIDSYSFGNSKVPGSSEMKLSETLPLLKKEGVSPIESLSEKPLSYGDIVTLYGDKRIQIDQDCRATPSAASFTVGTIIVLDNRSSEVKAVKFIEDTYAIPPLHVKIIELTRQGIFAIDCGTSKNVSIIRVN